MGTLKEKKSGMYGEMPEIKVGKYTISDMSNEDECTTVWIQNNEIDEGGEFNKGRLFEFIDKFYNEFF